MSTTFIVLYIILMVAVIVLLDIVYLRDKFRERLIVNILIVLVFAAVYRLFLK